MDVAIYLRKSRAEENMSLDEVLARHKNTLLQYCEAHRHAIIQIYEEVVSGESLYARPEMLKLLEDAGSGKFDAVACMDIDRLGRSGMKDQGIILETLKYSDTLIITPEKTYNLNDDMDEELTEFKSFFARRELKMINKRFRRGLNAAIQDGAYVANAPFGYKKTTVNKLPTLEIDEKEAAYVKMMFEMYRNGQGCTIIANYLNSLGIKPRRTDQFNRSSVMFILKNQTYIGKVVWNRRKMIKKGSHGSDKHKRIYQPKDTWIYVDGLHPAIIDNELFDEVQRISESHYISPYFTGAVRNPLVGLVKCGKCGSNMQLMDKMKGGPYLLCMQANCCAGAKFSLVENAVLLDLQSKLDILLAELPKNKTPDLSSYDKVLADIRKSRASTLTQINNLYDLLEIGEYTVDTYRMRKAELNARLSEYDAQESKTVQLRLQTMNESKQKLVDHLSAVLAVYESSDLAGKNKLLKSVVDSIVYFKEKKSKPHDFLIDVILRIF